jgi:methyl-accepting chemotaxis protein
MGMFTPGLGEKMLFQAKLHVKMIGAFLLIGVIVIAIGFIGWQTNKQLKRHIGTLTDDVLPSISSLWKVNEAQMYISSLERLLLNQTLDEEFKQAEIREVNRAFNRVRDGLKKFEATTLSEEEERLYHQFVKNWEIWNQYHDEFMKIYQDFEKIGIPSPVRLEIALLNQGKGDSLEMTAAKTAASLLGKLDPLLKTKNQPAFAEVTTSLLAIIDADEKIGAAAKKAAEHDMAQTAQWMVAGMIIGPLMAITLGIVLSLSIRKPISRAVNAIATTSSEMAATIAQQERVTAQQAAAVNETTATMDELDASFRQSAEQAEVSATRAREALTLTEAGTSTVKQTLGGMSSLKGKVGGIAEQILRLSEQTGQIGNITNLVSELANQTNLLALNAAVEAARAGEHGKGFGVVATEIRKLADQSKKSAERINTLVLDIQNATNATVMATEEGTKTVDQSTRLTYQTVEVFDGLAAAITTVFESSRQTLLNVKQQVAAVRQVVEAMEAINIGSKETVGGIAQTRIGVQQLNDAAQNLQIIV